jgi:hypothetical protein
VIFGLILQSFIQTDVKTMIEQAAKPFFCGLFLSVISLCLLPRAADNPPAPVTV